VITTFGNPNDPRRAINVRIQGIASGPQNPAIETGFRGIFPPPTDVGRASWLGVIQQLATGIQNGMGASVHRSFRLRTPSQRQYAADVRRHPGDALGTSLQSGLHDYGHCRITFSTNWAGPIRRREEGDLCIPRRLPHSCRTRPDGCEFVICFDEGKPPSSHLLVSECSPYPPNILAIIRCCGRDVQDIPLRTSISSRASYRRSGCGPRSGERNGVPPTVTFSLGSGARRANEGRFGPDRDSRNFTVSTTVAAAL